MPRPCSPRSTASTRRSPSTCPTRRPTSCRSWSTPSPRPRWSGSREHGRKSIPKGQTWQQLGEILASQPDGGDEWLHKHMPAPARLPGADRPTPVRAHRARSRGADSPGSTAASTATRPEPIATRRGRVVGACTGDARATPGRARTRTPRAARGRAAPSFVRMRLMCVFTVASREELARRDLGVREPARGEREDLALALGEVAVGRGHRPGRGIREVREELAGGGCRDHGRSRHARCGSRRAGTRGRRP